MRSIQLDANRIITDGEVHEFATAEAAEKRYRFGMEALTWQGTPFKNCGDTKGKTGAIDCAMLMVRSAVDTGLIPPFDPRPYPPQWFQHQDRERFLEIMQSLGAREIDTPPRFGDAIIRRIGRCYAHGTIVINSREIVHAWFSAGICTVSLMREPAFDKMWWRGREIPAPKKTFDLWGG